MFPALSVISYRTVLLHNVGDWPLTFCLERSSNPALAESAFVVPSCGLIQPGDHQILSLRAVPAEDSSDQGFKLHLQLNASKLTKVRPCTRASVNSHSRFYVIFILLSVNVSFFFRNWQLSVWWKSCVCLWKEAALYISSQQQWARRPSAPITSGTEACCQWGRLPDLFLRSYSGRVFRHFSVYCL